MEVILLENIENLGALGDKVTVKSGYARNFLVPGGKAKPATAENLAEFEKKRAELERVAAEALTEAEKRKTALEALEKVTISAKVGGEGKLFGSIGTADVSQALTDAGCPVEKREVRMPEGAIRTVGEQQIDIHLYTDVDVTVIIEIVGED